jgi:chemotaxis signal transduction protein
VSAEATSGGGPATGDDRYLLVEAGDDRCILPLTRVRRIVRELQVTPLPGASAELKGLAEFGGEPLAVLDFSRLIGASPGANPAYPVTVIAWAGSEGARELVGLQVDSVLEVVSVAADAIVSGGEGIVRGDVSLQDQPVRVISLSALGSVA